MHKRTILLTSSMLSAGILALALLWLLGVGMTSVSAAPAAGLQVCPNGCAFPSIQEAVDAATPGEVIRVAQGVYTGVHVRAGITQVVYISKTVTVRGGYNDDFSARNPVSYPTTVDARGQGRVFVVGTGISPTIEGLRITGGFVQDPLDRGGGIYVENAGGIISDNLIYSNTTDYYGGGLYLSSSSARLIRNDVLSNTTSESLGRGGGIHLIGGTPEVPTTGSRATSRWRAAVYTSRAMALS